MKILIWLYQLWVGLSTPILIDTCPCPWVPDHWLTWLWHSMHNYQFQIQYQAWTIPPLCQNDKHIMDILALAQLPTHQLEQINTCKMFLQVTTLAEITDHTGTMLLPQAFIASCNHPPKGLQLISQSLLEWPTVHNPSISCWKLWTKLSVCTSLVLLMVNTFLSPWTMAGTSK